MPNYQGYFRSHDEDNLYRVRLINSPGVDIYTEIKMAGDTPFQVRYDASQTLYAPVRTSKATVRIVNNTYMEDILPSHTHGTRVELYNETLTRVEWVGFLTPKVYSQDYVREYEVIDLEAEDCLSTLQYISYTDDTAYTKSIVTIKSILDRINDECELTDGYYWTRTKMVGNTVLLPSHLKIAEWNFFSTDTDESWKLDEVLTEICRYFGFTCMQWRDRIYFADLESYRQNNDIYCTYFSKPNYLGNSTTHIGGALNIDQDYVMASDAQISFKPVFNRVTVNANMSACEDFVPTPFEDSDLTNRKGDGEEGRPLDFYANYEVIPIDPARPRYPNGSSWWNQKYSEDDDVDDNAKKYGDRKYRYFHRLYDNKYWESVYYIPSTMQEITKESMGNAYRGQLVTDYYIGGTIVDLGVVQKQYISDYYQYITPSKLDYTRYLCLHEGNKARFSGQDIPMFRLKPGYKPPCFLDASKSYLVINYSAIFERYEGRPYINPDWTNNALKIGGWHSSSSEIHTDGCLYFKLKIGDKYWNGREWGTEDKIFPIVVERTTDDFGTWNDERHTLNNVSWDMFVNEEGYKIPLADVDLLANMEFEVHMPTAQFAMRYNDNPWDYSFNPYCWLKDLSIKCVQVGADGNEEDESDVLYENIIDTDAVSTLDDITVKLTTASELTKPSYSNVIYYYNNTNSLLATVKEKCINGNQENPNGIPQKPEENIVEKYVTQYSTTTKQIDMTLTMDVTPFNLITGIDVESPSRRFVQLSTEIDYKRNAQEIKFEEIK